MLASSHPSPRTRWRSRLLAGIGTAAVGLVLMAAPAAAQADEVDPVQVNLDNVWVLLAAVLVIFMQAGFAMVEAGLTRAKNVANIMMKNLMDFSVGVTAFLAIGFAIAFGGSLDGSGKYVGADGFFLGDGAFTYGNLTVPVFFIFQAAFCATAATIVSGAMAERTKFKAYLVYSLVLSAVVYPIVVRWQWGGGWLYQLDTPYHDFAGSSIVHMVGGVAAFWGAKALGPRIGKYGPDGKPRAILGHNIPYAILGCFILLVGWYGFNAGSELAADAAIGPIAVTTTAAAGMGAIAAMLLSWLRDGKPDVGMAGNGLLGGLVGITAGTAAVTPQAALIIGGAAGILVVLAVSFIERVIRVDDPVGAIAVHGVCGAFGTLCVGLFAREDAEGFWKQGLFYGGGTDQLISQVTGVVAIAVWVSVCSIILFYGLKALKMLRVSPEEELGGLDIEEHGSAGYGEGFGSFTPSAIPAGVNTMTAAASTVPVNR